MSFSWLFSVHPIRHHVAMRSEIQSLIDEFKQKRFRSDMYPAVLELIDARSPDIVTLVEMVLEQLPEAGVFFNDALSFVPEAELPRLVAEAVRKLEQGPTDPAESLIAKCSLQAVEALHPHLDALLSLRPNWSSYYSQWPWRGSGDLQFEELSRLAERGENRVDALQAWRLLLEKRDPGILQYCRERSEKITEAIRHGRSGPSNMDAEFHHVGFELSDGRQLYGNTVAHFIFPDDYWRPEPTHLEKRHPTWRGERFGSSQSYRLGGAGTHTCGACGEPGHRLLTFDTIPEALNITGLVSVAFETCATCVNIVPGLLFYSHSGDGSIRPINAPPRHTPEFRCGPLKEVEVRIAVTPSRWRWQDWALSNGRQNLHRIGGHPCWIQSAEYLTCPMCTYTMTSLFQFDTGLVSVSEDGNDDEAYWGSGGILYGQWCDRCKVSGYALQCT